MDIVGINGFRAVARVAAVTAAVTVLSGVAWAQYSSGASGRGPHTGPSGNSMGSSEMSPSAAGQGASCGPGAAAADSRCGESSGSSGNVEPSPGDEGGGGGVSVNDLKTMPRNDKIPSRRTDE